MAWAIDTVHSSIQFSVRHMLVTTARGSFKTFSGDVSIDVDHPEKSVLSGTIDANSIYTGEEKRDGHLRSADFFDVEKFPKISFKSKRIEPLGDGKYKVYGDLTIRDVTKEIVLDAESEAGVQKHPFSGGLVWGVSATGTINRKDFGLNWNVALEAGGFMVADQVKILIEAEFVKQPEVVATQTA